MDQYYLIHFRVQWSGKKLQVSHESSFSVWMLFHDVLDSYRSRNLLGNMWSFPLLYDKIQHSHCYVSQITHGLPNKGSELEIAKRSTLFTVMNADPWLLDTNALLVITWKSKVKKAKYSHFLIRRKKKFSKDILLKTWIIQ